MAKTKPQGSDVSRASKIDPATDLARPEVIAKTANANSRTDSTLRLASEKVRAGRVQRALFGLIGLVAFVSLMFSAFASSTSISLQLLVMFGTIGPSLAFLVASLLIARQRG